MGPTGCTVDNALHKWRMSIFWSSAEAINWQIRNMVVQESLHIYILTENDIIGYFGRL